MKNTLFGLTILFVSILSAIANAASNTVSIKPSIVRDDPVPQVFIDGGGTYYISTASIESYNRVMNSLNTSLQNHKAVTYKIDPTNNMIIDVDGAVKAESVSIYEEDSPTSSSGSGTSASSNSGSSSGLGKMPTSTGASSSPAAGANTGAMPQNH